MNNPNLKGAVAELEIATAAAHLGIPVLRPMAEHGRYDLALEIAGEIMRVQCKWGALDRESSVIRVNFQGCRHTPRGAVYRSYEEHEIDLLGIYCRDLDQCYLLPSALVAGRGSMLLRTSPPLNGQRACINLASDYEFTGAVAQLEERRYGIPEAGGSSPPSSIPSEASTAVTEVGAHQFRNHFGYYLERAAAGDEIRVSRHGRKFVKLSRD